MQRVGRLKLLSAAAIVIGGWTAPAVAADLGGDCCADLEERIAELEATAARKGNRKVSLTVSGWVSEMVMWWDDGAEKNAYVGTSPVEQSRVRFLGQAKITSDVSAGYILELGIWGGNASTWDQSHDDGASGNSILIRKSSWFLKSNTFGKLTVGLDATATYHLLDDADTTMTRNFYDGEAPPDYARPFFIRDNAGGFINNLRWSDVLRGFNNSTPGDNGRRNVVRYDTPEFGGFSVATSWGEDDIWDAALIYAGTVGDFTVNGRAGYGKSTDGDSTPCHPALTPDNGDCEWWGVSGLIQHNPTGLFVFAGYGEQRDDTRGENLIVPGAVDKTDTTWYVQGGIEKKWFDLGKTNVFGMFRHDDPGANVSTSGNFTTQGANVDYWAVGAAQNLEAAEATLYVVYQHTDGNVLLGNAGTDTEISALQQVIGGMKINY
jgi:predicted porin